MDRFTVIELKHFLKEKGQPTAGNKDELIERLVETFKDDGQTVEAFVQSNLFDKDSLFGGVAAKQPTIISHISGKTHVSGKTHASGKSHDSGRTQFSGSIKDDKIREAAKKAGIEARIKWLKEKHQIERDLNEMEQRKQLAELTMEVAEMEAKEKVLQDHLLDEESDGMKNSKPIEIKYQFPNKAPMEPTRAKSQDEDLMSTLVSFNMKSLMPKASIPVFDGTYTQYHSFIKAFDSIISSRLNSDEEKLYYLSQYTTGKPLNIVKACMHRTDGHGYKEARKTLEKRYGDMERIACAYIDAILQWKTIKREDIEALDEFSIMLTNCCNAVANSDSKAEVEHPKTMREILKKLPDGLQEKWCRKVDKINEFSRRKVMFEDLVQFIEDEARIASNPVFGRRHFMNDQFKNDRFKKENNHFRRKEASTFNAVNQKSVKCWHCQGNHYIDKCENLKQLQRAEILEIVKGMNLCFRCLGYGHRSAACRRSRVCDVCGGSHHTLLHRSQNDNYNSSTRDPTAINSYEARNRDIAQENVGAISVETNRVNQSQTVYRMNIVPVSVHYSGRRVDTHAFLDPGSSSTFCSEDLCKQLGISCTSKNKIDLSLSTIRPKFEILPSFAIDNLVISDIDQNNFINLPTVFTLDRIPASYKDIVPPEELASWDHLKGIKWPSITSKIQLMIGNNIPEAEEPWEVVHSKYRGGPYGVRTLLGWVVKGTICSLPHRFNRISVNTQELQEQLIDMYNREFEDLHQEKEGFSQEDKYWLEKVEGSCKKMTSGHYEIALPFRNNFDLPDSRFMALKRLEYLKKKLNDPVYKEEYKRFIDQILMDGYVEKVPNEEIDRPGWHLPHFGVLHPQKKSLRVVYDCAAKVGNKSLNDALIPGPNLTNTLLEVLLRFRLGQYCFTADLEKMFYQVFVPEKQRNFLQFYWWENFDDTPLVYRMKVHLFGACSSPSVASFALRKTATDFEKVSSNDNVNVVYNNFYVDDCLLACNSKEMLAEAALQVKSICASGGFNLHKFTSNTPGVLEGLPVEATADPKTFQNVLGVHWNVTEDTLQASFDFENLPDTRRTLLRVIAAMYDPLGLAAPFVLQGRIILQETCRRNFGWDQKLPETLKEEIKRWLDGLNKLEAASSRNILTSTTSIRDSELHLFSDASENGYGVVAYTRIKHDHGYRCSFVYGKARVAPLKTVSIPRLELSAAALLVRVGQTLISAFMDEPKRVVFWTDSSTVLRYIHNEKTKFMTFVANRLAIIREGSQPRQWKYINTLHNPADDASRARQTERWNKGPEFLYEDEKYWPRPPEVLDNMATDELEVKKVKVFHVNVISPLSRLLLHFSDWYKLKRIVAWLIKYKNFLFNRRMENMNIGMSEMKAAEASIIRIVQEEEFSEERKDLQSRGFVKAGSSLRSLNPFIDSDDVVRVGGRIKNCGLDYDATHPMILPYKHHITDLIIRNCHENVGHLGRNSVLSRLGENFWIVKKNQAVRRVLKNCVDCRRYKGKEMEQMMADLPKERINPVEAPFENTGCDCFGPFYIKQKRSEIKRYGIIFVCLAIKAIHLETLENLSTPSMLNALRRFVARRGNVKTILSDRGTNFVGASKELQEDKNAIDVNLIKNSALKMNIEWNFNPPCASNFGGIWERQIRTVRQVLASVLNEQVLTDESLSTLFCEVEAIVNGRPITSVSGDVGDPLPLSPGMLLTMKPTVDVPLRTEDSNIPKARWRQVQYLSNLFWTRWSKEYLSELQKRQKWTKARRNLEAGDVVLIRDESKQRHHWPLGIVKEAKISKDGFVRSAILKSNQKTIERPVNKLIMILECDN